MSRSTQEFRPVSDMNYALPQPPRAPRAPLLQWDFISINGDSIDRVPNTVHVVDSGKKIELSLKLRGRNRQDIIQLTSDCPIDLHMKAIHDGFPLKLPPGAGSLEDNTIRGFADANVLELNPLPISQPGQYEIKFFHNDLTKVVAEKDVKGTAEGTLKFKITQAQSGQSTPPPTTTRN